MGADKELCGLDITLDDIRKIENQYDVTIHIQFNKIARAWCFDFERPPYSERYILPITFLSDMSKDIVLKDFAHRALVVQQNSTANFFAK